MANTLATEKQADAIKHRMAEIRTELPYRADVARLRVKQLADWKYHLSRHPLPILAAALAAGYLLVPSKPSSDRVIVDRSSALQPAPVPEPAKKSLLGGIVGAIATIALKQASTMAMSKVSHLLSQPDRPS